MTVNITVIIQMIHFFIAYLMLERLFFRYAVDVILKRDGRINCLNQSLAEEKRAIESLRMHVNEQWQRYSRMLHHEIPSLALPKLIVDVEPLYRDKSEKDKKEQENIQSQLKKILVNRCLHD